VWKCFEVKLWLLHNLHFRLQARQYRNLWYTEGFLDDRKNINKFFVKNSNNIFSREASELITKYISYFSVGEKVTLSNGKKATIEKHTNDPMHPIVRLKDDTILNLSDVKDKISIVSMISK